VQSRALEQDIDGRPMNRAAGLEVEPHARALRSHREPEVLSGLSDDGGSRP
jgi:hypothetical protein